MKQKKRTYYNETTGSNPLTRREKAEVDSTSQKNGEDNVVEENDREGAVQMAQSKEHSSAQYSMKEV